MRYILPFMIIIFAAVVPCAAQRRATAADRAWPQFYTSFRMAARKQDKAALRKLILPKEFQLESEYGSPDDIFSYLDKSPDGGWSELVKIVTRGAVTGRGHERIIKLRGLPLGAPVGFVFKGNRWFWSAYLYGD